VSRRDDERLADILASADAIGSHLRRGGLDDGLVFDAVRVRLIEIGEAVKDISDELLAAEGWIPAARWWSVPLREDPSAGCFWDGAGLLGGNAP
jgi:uncharacterized protein with HEPN domain